MIARATVVGWLFGAIVALAGCGGHDAAPTPPAARTRVVSLFPSWTEALFAMGLGDRLVARSNHCDYPESVRALPSLGDGLTVNMEALLRTAPDLVLVYDPDLATRIRRLGIAAESIRAETLDDVYRAYERIGDVLGVPERGRVLAQRMRTAIADAATRWRDRPPRRVLFCVDAASGVVAGRGNFVDELINAVGGVNVGRNAPGRWPVYSLEAVLRTAPDVILYATPDGASAAASAFLDGLRETPAGKAGRVFPVREALVTRSGPRLADAAAVLGRLIHDGVVGER